MTRATWTSMSRYDVLYRDRGQRDRLRHDASASACTLRHGAMRTRHDAQCAQHGPLHHDTILYRNRGAATRQEAAYDKAPRFHDTALCAQPERSTRTAWTLGCAHCALDLVLTQCIVYSHCLDHCS